MLKVLDSAAVETIIGGMNNAGSRGEGGGEFIGPVRPSPAYETCVAPKSYPDFSERALPVARPSDGRPLKSVEEVRAEREQAVKVYDMWTELYEGLRR